MLEYPSSITRHAWVDVAKGFCIIFIVLGHVVHSNMMFTASSGFWFEFVRAFSPLRIPLFLFVSGYLARSSMDRPLSASFAKTGGLYLIYVIWELAFAVLQSASGMLRGAAQPSVGNWVIETTSNLLLPTTFWYIWALPAYYLLSWFLRHRFGEKASLAFLPLGIIALVTPFVAFQADGWQTQFNEITIAPVLANIVWFHAGVYGRATWHALLSRASLLTFVLASTLYSTTYLIFRIADADKFAQVALAPLALIMASQCLGSVNLHSATARMLEKVGQFTLPVYVMHLFGLSVLVTITNMPSIRAFLSAAPMLLDLVVPIVATGLLVFACRRAGRMILASPLRGLLQPMKWPFAKSSSPTVQEQV